MRSIAICADSRRTFHILLVGVSTAFCIGFGAVAGTTLVIATFRLNARYGPHGMMKKAATARHPRRIISRKSIVKLFNSK